MNAKRYANGAKWLGSHGFVADNDEQCYKWVKVGVVVCFDNYYSKWCAYATFNAAWKGDDCTTPKSAIESLREVFERARNSLLKQAQIYSKAIECVDDALEKEKKMKDEQGTIKQP